MESLRRHAFLIICSVVGLAGVGLAVTGLKAMPGVVQEMDKAASLYQELGNLQSRPVNQDSIDAQSERIERIRSDHQSVITKARAMYGYEPLVPGVFPNGDTTAKFAFLRRYNVVMLELMDSLTWGGLPTEPDINMMRERIEDEQARARPLGLDRGVTASEPVFVGDEHTPAGVLTKAGARTDADARASMAAARQIHCYATPYDTKKVNAVPSLYFHPYMEDTGTLDAPEMEDIWWAQVTHWIQQDVVEAIVAVNDEAAGQIQGRNEDWVGVMPVKEIVSIRLAEDYILPDDAQFVGAAPEGFLEALPPGTPNTVFTKSVSDPSYEVMQFTLKLIMDQRDIPRLVDRICKGTFHTLLRVAYRAVPPNREMVGKIYGEEPTVMVVMDFETIMLGTVFRPLMPSEICESERYEYITCPEPEGEDEGD